MTFLELVGFFLEGFVLSILIGFLVGMITSWIFKTMRFLTHSCVLEISIIVLIGYVSFTICEMLHLSGVLSVLVTGVVLGHYNIHNISAMGKISS